MHLSWIFLIGFIIEIWLLITWGAELGLFGTLLEFITSGMLGMYVIRTIGFNLMTKVNREMQMGQTPQLDNVPSFLTICAGILLIIPGFLTDTIAVLLSLPWVKSRVLNKVWTALQKNAHKHSEKKPRSPVIIDQKDD